MFIQQADTTRTPCSNTAQSSYSTFIQHADRARKYQQDSHIIQNLFLFQFKKIVKEQKKRHFHTTQKIQHAYNTFIQHKKYNIRWAFWERVYRHRAVPRVKVQKFTTGILKTYPLSAGHFIHGPGHEYHKKSICGLPGKLFMALYKLHTNQGFIYYQ